MNLAIRIVTLATLLAGMSGCDTVTSLYPVGTPVPSSDAKQLEGVWLVDEPIYVRHVKDHELRIGSLKWVDGHFQVDEGTVLVTQDDDALSLLSG